MIYLIQSSEYLKIGYTSNMEQRKNAYNTHNPNCQFLAVIDGGRSAELKVTFTASYNEPVQVEREIENSREFL